MTDYKVIKGLKVSSVASDPSPATTGQLWYDTATDDLKFTTVAGAWSSGNNMNTGRNEGGFVGTQTVGMVFGGTTPAKTVNTETYDGTCWTEVNNLTLATSSMTTAGTQTAALCVGGNHFGITAVESWDGTSWTDNAAVMNQSLAHASGGGIQTAAMAYGGQQTTMTSNSETWNGTSWTEGNNLVDTLTLASGDGTVTSAMAAGGGQGAAGRTNKTETYDGTCWSEQGGDMNQGRDNGGGTGNASTFLVQGGTFTAPTGVGPPGNPDTDKTEEWDGTSWSTKPTMATSRSIFNAAGGSITASVCAGGSSYAPVGPSFQNLTEEWTVAGTTKTVTVS